jgi:hypothetical protein
VQCSHRFANNPFLRASHALRVIRQMDVIHEKRQAQLKKVQDAIKLAQAAVCKMKPDVAAPAAEEEQTSTQSDEAPAQLAQLDMAPIAAMQAAMREFFCEHNVTLDCVASMVGLDLVEGLGWKYADEEPRPAPKNNRKRKAMDDDEKNGFKWEFLYLADDPADDEPVTDWREIDSSDAEDDDDDDEEEEEEPTPKLKRTKTTAAKKPTKVAPTRVKSVATRKV